MVDEFSHLSVLNPAVGMEDEDKQSLLGHGGIERRLEILDRSRMVIALQILGLPIGRYGAGKLPVLFADEIWVGVVGDGIDEVFA